MSPPVNTAAWLPHKKAPKLEIKSAPYTAPGTNEIVVKNGAVAINPLDWKLQEQGDLIFTWLKYPFILGSDVAGEVVEVGSGVTRFKVGQRVIGSAVGSDEKFNRAAEGGFQTYTIIQSNLAAPIPDHWTYEQACVIPLGASTAACGLFEKDQLALQYPTVPRAKPTGKTLLVWGGASSVGCNAIQLAVAAGYEVFTTASPKNFDLVKKLGASQVFDYRSSTVTQDIIAAYQGKITAGVLWIGSGLAGPAFDILKQTTGNKFLSLVAYPTPEEEPTKLVFLRTAAFFMSSMASYWLMAKRRGIRYKFVFGSTLACNEVGKLIYEDFLPQALANGSFVAAPEPLVVGKGLERLEEAMAIQKKGVSAKKVVVSL